MTKAELGLFKLHVGIGWVAEDANGNPTDCDVSVFMVDANGKIPGDEFFVFYHNLTSSDGSAVHQGDNTIGEGDDEEIKINISKVDNSVIEMLFIITIYDADKNGQDFSMVHNLFIRILNDGKQKELCRYNLVSSFVGCDSVEIGRAYRSGDNWEFGDIETGYSG